MERENNITLTCENNANSLQYKSALLVEVDETVNIRTIIRNSLKFTSEHLHVIKYK